MKDMLGRYQGVYKINLKEVSTAHSQMCRDFITRFQRVLNRQMKVLLKLVLRFEKQINDEKAYIAETAKLALEKHIQKEMRRKSQKERTPNILQEKRENKGRVDWS